MSAHPDEGRQDACPAGGFRRSGGLVRPRCPHYASDKKPPGAPRQRSMSTRQIALSGTLLAIVFLAHAAGRFTQIGGAQFAPSIAIYTLMALLLAPQLGWGPLVGIGLATGILTMLATSSPFPPANIPAHGIGFLTAAALAK